MIRSMHQGLLADGFAVPLTKLCAWVRPPGLNTNTLQRIFRLKRWQLPRSGKVRMAANAREHTLITRICRFGRVLQEFLPRSENGLVFPNRKVTALLRGYGLKPEVITPQQALKMQTPAQPFAFAASPEQIQRDRYTPAIRPAKKGSPFGPPLVFFPQKAEKAYASAILIADSRPSRLTSMSKVTA